MTQESENDLRFQFDVIRSLSESVRQMATTMAEMQRTLMDVSVRTARLEENKVNEEVASVKADMKILDARVDTLFTDKNRRDGAGTLLGAALKYGPVIFSLLTVLYLFGRSIGVVPSPPMTVTAVAAPMRVLERSHVEGAEK